MSETETRQRYQRLPNDDWDPDLPYGGKVFLARKKRPDPTWVRVAEASLVIALVCFSYYAYYYFDHLHFHVTKAYAHAGFKDAQHQIGQRYLHGKGVKKHPPSAMEWFEKAAKQGHPHASYNLAIGHLKGIPGTNIQKGELRKHLLHAATHGIKQAHHVLNEQCERGNQCD